MNRESKDFSHVSKSFFWGAILLTVFYCGGPEAATVTINPGVQHQTIMGWGASSSSPPWTTQTLREEIIDEGVNDLGLTRLRLEPPGGNRSTVRRWEWLNDDGDPDHINWSAMETAAFDQRISEFILPFKQRVDANGDPFDIYISPSFFNNGSTGKLPAWLRYSPGEYAEYALSLILRLKNTHNITPTYYCICNEAGNNNPFTAALVADMIKTLGPKLEALGLPTKIEFPESINPRTSWNYIQNVRDDGDLWPYVGVITYHLYGTKDPYRSQIRDFARSKGLPTGQTEYMGLNMNHLYDDLTLGGVSYWELYGMGQWIKPNPDNTSFTRYKHYWNFRQVMHYVRPGAVRIEAASDDSAVRVLAFARNGKMTVVLINGSGARSVTVHNLAAGAYGICQSANAGGSYHELGLRTVGGAGTLTVNIPSNTILTIYPHAGANQPPTLTDWRANPSFLTMPASSTNLSASATDPELDALSYSWSVASRPAGASVVLGTPNSAQTQATGLTVAGKYVFTVAVSDSAHTVSRDVVLIVHSGNEPPIPVDVHNRIPVMLTLPESSTSLRGGASDLEGDPLTYRWSVVSQPAGAAVLLATPAQNRCQASNMTVPGEYVFKFEVSDPTHTVAETLTVPVYPTNSAPVISSASASPDMLRLPDSRTSLSAATSDPDGDVISHWWSVKSCPAQAKPVFANQGSRETTVSGLVEVGTYVFTLTVVDRTKYTRRDVTVTVEAGALASQWFGKYK